MDNGSKCNMPSFPVLGVFDKAVSSYGSVNIAVNNVGLVHEFNAPLCMDVNLVSL